jgi:hypothetical protein
MRNRGEFEISNYRSPGLRLSKQSPYNTALLATFQANHAVT